MTQTDIILERVIPESAVQPHSLTPADLRLFAYAEKFGETIPQDVAEHLGECDECEQWLKILHQTDPVLAEKDADRVKQLVREARSDREEKLAVPMVALGAAVGASAGAAVSIFRSLFGSAEGNETTEERFSIADPETGEMATAARRRRNSRQRMSAGG